MSERIVQMAIQNGDLSRYMERIRILYRERLSVLLEAISTYLPTCKVFKVPQGGYFMWLGLPKGVRAGPLVESAKQFNVSFTAGHRCSAVLEGASDSLGLKCFYFIS